MKSFKDVESTRRDYHRDVTLNSVHRSSTTVPEIPGARATVSFLNHFLIKHGHRNVACRVTAVDAEGQRIEARLHEVTEECAYTIPLSGTVSDEVNTYVIDFYSSQNLFFPYPAVMVNHAGDGFFNGVHGFNRVLNDTFEEDTVNARRVAEASIDVRMDAETDTFVNFTAGPQHCRGELQFDLTNEAGQHNAVVELDQPHLTSRRISLKETFPNIGNTTSGVLKILQPAQFMFYGRMLTGTVAADGAFSANHSYYDSSSVAEYWDDDRPSLRSYPYFRDLDNIIRLYPIMSECRLAVSVDLYDAGGRHLGSVPAGEIESPGAGFIDVSINALAASHGLGGGEIANFTVVASQLDGRVPTRIGHQLVQNGGGLESSVNLALKNPNIFVPEGKASMAWGQAPVGRDVETWLGLVTNTPDGESCEVDITFYGTQGPIARRQWTLPAAGAINLKLDVDLADEFGDLLDGETACTWYVARTARPDLSAYTVTRHRASGHCTGEHYF